MIVMMSWVMGHGSWALADAGADVMISGNWIIALLIALIPVLGGVWIKAKAAGRTEAQDNHVTLKKPVPTIQTREEQRWVPRDEYMERWERADAETSRLWNQFGHERKIWNHEIENVQTRLATQSEATASLQGTVNEVNKTVGQLLSLALNRKPPARL